MQRIRPRGSRARVHSGTLQMGSTLQCRCHRNSAAEDCQSRHGAASPMHLRCRVLPPGSRSGKKRNARTGKSLPWPSPWTALNNRFSFETLFHRLTERENLDRPSPFLNHSRDCCLFSTMKKRVREEGWHTCQWRRAQMHESRTQQQAGKDHESILECMICRCVARWCISQTVCAFDCIRHNYITLTVYCSMLIPAQRTNYSFVKDFI